MRKKNIQKNKRNSEPKSSGEIVIYKTPGKEIEVRVSLEKDTVWLTQVQIAFIFGTERSVITKHINNVFKSGELERKSNVQKMHIPGSDRPVHFYNLDVVISIGYRVNSKRASLAKCSTSLVVNVISLSLNHLRLLTNLLKSFSFNTLTPNFLALVILDPGFSPATT